MRISTNLKLILVLGLPLCVVARADTVLAPPYQAIEPDQPGDTYQESSFGSPPAKIEMGVTPHYASRAAKEFDVTDEYNGDSTGSGSGVERNPAGLVFGDDGAMPPSDSQRMERQYPENSGTRTALAEVPSESTETSALVRKGVQEVAIIAGDLGFFPKTIFVTRDVPVRLFVTGASKNTLCIMMDSFQVRKQVRSQKIEEISFTPNMPGKYRFYCPVNGMEGSMIVKELSTAVAEQAPVSPVSGQQSPNERAPSSVGGTQRHFKAGE